MGSSFNSQILADKLAKLNSSQASIETLSHWCIFHMHKAKHVVETWDKQFHLAPREQRLAYLYLANDILQNSRRKGSEFVGEFWKVLPDALHDVIENGDESGRNAALRLINIWEERKVFGSRGQILKEECLGRQPENGNRNVKLKQPIQKAVDKIVSSYEGVYGRHTDEDVTVSKCSNAVSYLEKVEKEVMGNHNTGHSPGPAVVKEVQGQHAILRDCIEQLRAIETSRTNLVSHLREALHEQELKLEQVRTQLQAAESQSDRADNFCRQLLEHKNPHPGAEQNPNEVPASLPPQSLEQLAPVMYTQPALSVPENPNHEEDIRKSAAAVAAKLTASTSSAQMLSYVLSSLASEGVIENPPIKDSPSVKEYHPPEKRPKLENPQQPNVVSFSETPQHNATTTSQEALPSFPSLPPPLQQLPGPQFQLPQFLQPLQPPGPINHVPFNYISMSVSTTQQQASSVPGYSPSGTQIMPDNSGYQNFQGSQRFYSTT